MENKKKILVPIIIGVAILLVLIIGATYAYFQATNTASGTTSVEASTEKIGTVIVTNPTESLHLNLYAYDMQESKKGTSYYATDDSSKRYETEAKNYPISEYSVSGGEADTVYNCTYKLNITKSSDIRLGDMKLKLNLNGATIDGITMLDVDLASVSNSYTVEFRVKGNSNGTLVTGDIIFNNTNSVQDHLIGKILSTTITNSDLSCEVREEIESICTYDSTSTMQEGLVGAKYNCKVDPNKPEYSFYLLDNNDDGTSDLIMSHNINASGEAVIPGVTEDKGITAWNEGSYSNATKYGPITAMTYLYNATKSWTNVKPVSYEYYDQEYGYESFISTNGIAVITANDGTTTNTIGTELEPLRTRMPIYGHNVDGEEYGELAFLTNKPFLYDNLNNSNDFIDNWEDNGPYGYWALSTGDGEAWNLYLCGDAYMNVIDDVYAPDATILGVRPVITVKL